MEKNKEIARKTKRRHKLKVRRNVSLNPVLDEWATNKRLNVSGILNETLNGLKSVTDECVSLDNVKIGLILNQYGKIKWTRWNSNPGPPPCQDNLNYGLESSKEVQNERIENPKNFSTLAGKVSVGEYVSDPEFQEAYLSFCKKTGMDANYTTSNDYLKAISKLDDVYTPADLSDYADNHNGKAITDKGRKGLLKLFKYIETRLYQESFNGIGLNVWRANLRITEKGESRMSGRNKDLTDEEVLAARDSLKKDDLKLYFTMLAYSGARHSHLYQALKEKREIHSIGADVIYMDVADLSAGRKYESRFYFPALLEKQIKKFKISHNKSYYSYGICSGSDGRAVNAASLRKWQYSFLKSHGVDSLAADQIQGRVPSGVGAAHYANPTKFGEDAYQRIVGDLVDALPIS